MKDLIISWDEDKGFYCEDLTNQLFADLLIDLICKYNLNTDNVKFISETSMYFTLKESNKNDYNIVLINKDGSDWSYG